MWAKCPHCYSEVDPTWQAIVLTELKLRFHPHCWEGLKPKVREAYEKKEREAYAKNHPSRPIRMP